MTLNSKVLSLVLLTGLTMGGAFAKKQKPTDWNNDSHSVKWSEEKCDAAEANKNCSSCTKPCSQVLDSSCNKSNICCSDVCCSDLCAAADCTDLLPCCVNCTQVLRFQGNFSFEQVVGSDGLPRPHNQHPGPLCGKVELAFDPAFTKLCWRITLCTKDAKYYNAQPTAAFLYVGDCNDTLNSLSPIGRSFLSPITAATLCTRGDFTQPICNSGCITAEDLQCNSVNSSGSCQPINQSIACLYQSAIANNLFVSVEGSNCIALGEPSYTRASGGVLRAMVLPCLPTCAK